MLMETHGRRRFAQALGAAFGGTLLAPGGVGVALASLSTGQGDDHVQLNSNENPYGPSPGALEAMQRALGSVAARYPDASEEACTAAIARHHGVAAEQVILGCGSGEILRMADLATLAADKTVVCADPSFEAVLMYARVTKAKARRVPLDDQHRHDLVGLAKACDARTGLVYVCNPNNPTGTLVGADDLARFLSRVPKHVTVLVDEAYHHFVESPLHRSAAELLPRHGNLLVVRTFSKIYGLAGLRLGYALGAPALIEGLRTHAFASNANAAALAGALASLEDVEHVARTRQRLNDTRRALCRELERDGRRYMPSETNFVMIHVGRDVAPVIEALRLRKVLVGRRFPSLAEWLRVSIGTDADMAAFLRVFRELVPVRAAA